MTTFDKLGLSNNMLSAVERMGYTQPTPVQEKAIPLVLRHRDVIAAAQTGTGKTASFALPAMDTLPHAKGGSGPHMLVITPTRELANQIGDVCTQIATSTHHRITTVVGGLSYKPQIDRLSHGTDVLIATPGRLIDLMEQSAVRLADVNVLVLDEADRMLDMGFLPAVKKIVAATPKNRQTLLFSATIDGSIKTIAGSMLRDPATVEIAHKGDVANTVDQFVIHTPQGVKPTLLPAVLQEKGFEKVIVFARTRSRADSCARRLKRAGFYAEAIHSDRSQAQRRRALNKFATGEVNIICATDVLARGIDIDQVDYVINYDTPEQPENYIHRIGRTGRAGNRGFAITFVTPETESNIRAIQKTIKQEIPELTLEHFDWEKATAEAVTQGQRAQTRRDPAIAEAKRDLAKRMRKKARRTEAKSDTVRSTSSAPQKSHSSSKRALHTEPTKRSASNKDRNVKSRKTKSRTTRDIKTKDVATKSSATKGSHVQKQRSATKSGDFRPGRAHRAKLRQQASKRSASNKRSAKQRRR